MSLPSLVLQTCGCNNSLCCSSSPHVALLPGDDVKHSGDQEEGTQAQAVHPGSDPLPAVIRQAMQQRHAHDGQPNEGLQRWTEEEKNHTTVKTTCLYGRG